MEEPSTGDCFVDFLGTTRSGWVEDLEKAIDGVGSVDTGGS